MNELKNSFPINTSAATTTTTVKKAKNPKRYIAYFLLALSSYFGGRYFAPATTAEATEVVQVSQTTENEAFSEPALLAFMKKLKIKYPETVLSQARLETGNFSSDVFKENHNLFGMKVAGKRPTSAIGTNRNHAQYRNWKDSVIDYALFQSYIIAKLPTNTSDSYREYIQKFYSETGDYLARIDKMIKGDKEEITVAFNESSATDNKSL